MPTYITINDRSGLLVNRYFDRLHFPTNYETLNLRHFQKIVLGISLVAQNIGLLNIFISQDFYPKFPILPDGIHSGWLPVEAKSWILRMIAKLFLPYQPRNLFAEQSKSQSSWSRLCGSRGCNDTLICTLWARIFFLRAAWLLPRGISRLVSLGLVYWLWCWFPVFALQTGRMTHEL
jgi:hypothetical protein